MIFVTDLELFESKFEYIHMMCQFYHIESITLTVDQFLKCFVCYINITLLVAYIPLTRLHLSLSLLDFGSRSYLNHCSLYKGREFLCDRYISLCYLDRVF